MVTKVVHAGTLVTEKLYRSFKKIAGSKGSTVKDTLAELMSAYVEENEKQRS